ncbi:MAG: DUF1801 domain-containing protein [Chitinophagaceae bacterium]
MAKSNVQYKTVDEFIEAADSSLKALLTELRPLLNAFAPALGEQIKWNSPAYYYTREMGEFDAKTYARDYVVLNCHRGYVLMVFPNGASFNDPHKVLKENTPTAEG